MKRNLQKFMAKFTGIVASLATLIAVCNVNSTCIFLTHQPDVPEELKENN